MRVQIVCAVCVVVLAWVATIWWSGQSNSLSRWHGLLSGELAVHAEVLSWPGDPVKVLQLLRADTPYVLRHTPADAWPAMARWTPEYIHEHILSLERVQISHSHPLYEYHNAAPMGVLEDQGDADTRSSTASPNNDQLRLKFQKGSFQQINMSSTQFFDICLRDADAQSAPQPPFVYYAGNFGANNRILRDVGSPADFMMDHMAQDAKSGTVGVLHLLAVGS